MTETGQPWESTPLPEAQMMFECPGKTWHDGDYHPDQLQWMAKIDGSREWPVDGFYCLTCIFSAKRSAGVPVVTGPSLLKELERRDIGIELA